MDLSALTENCVFPSNKKRVRLSSLRSEKQKQSSENFSPLSLAHNHDIQTPSKTQNPKILLTSTKKNHKEKKLDEGIKNIDEYEAIETWNDYDKLLEITSRCIDYYNSFMEEKDVQMKIVKETFTEMHTNLNQSFHEIISDIKNKHNELKEFLNIKEGELLQIKNNQESSLNQDLTSINSIHLENLLKCKTEKADSERELCNYANTLHRFYKTMESVEKINFKESMEEVIGFVKNVMNEEIIGMRAEKLFGKEWNANVSFSFNDVIGNVLNQIAEENSKKSSSVDFTDNLIKEKDKEMIENETQTYEADELPERDSALEILCDITKKQENLHNKISTYKGLLLNNN